MAEAMLGINGEIICWAREYYNMQPNEAATAIGVDLQRYTNWESGQEFPTYAKLKKISEVFRKPSAVFFSQSRQCCRRLKATYGHYLMM